MRSGIGIVGGFVTGLLVGVLVTSHVWIRWARQAGELARVQFQGEQELLGNRSTRAGDAFRGAVHYLNVADAQAGVGFRWLERMEGTTYRQWFADPWSLYVVIGELEQDAHSPKIQHGYRMMEANYWARAAIALERFGRPDLAEAPWAAAIDRDPSRSIEWHREYARHDGPGGTEDLERAYLDAHTVEELAQILKEARERTLSQRARSDR
jgi:hypothetical protein